METKEETNHIHIKVDEVGRGFVSINGKKLHGVKKLEFSAEARELTTVTITLIKYDLTVDAEGYVDYVPVVMSAIDEEK